MMHMVTSNDMYADILLYIINCVIKIESQMFHKAWNHNLKSQRKRQQVIWKEFNNMKKHQVLRKVLKSLLPPNQRCVKNNMSF